MATAQIKKGSHADGKKRYRLTVTDGDDSITDDVVVPNDEMNDRAYLVDRARLFFQTIKNRQRIDAEEMQEAARWENPTDEAPVLDVDLQKSRER